MASKRAAEFAWLESAGNGPREARWNGSRRGWLPRWSPTFRSCGKTEVRSVSSSDLKRSNTLYKSMRLLAHGHCGCCRLLHTRCVSLRYFVHLGDGLIHLFDPVALLFRSRRNLLHDRGDSLDRHQYLFHALAGVIDERGAALNATIRMLDQSLDDF